jgi:4-amino-4-deoxy-L-arabinose transferase-like glycosyltransferase
MMYISSAVVLVGVLFKLMFWNGGETILTATLPILVFFVVAWALNQRLNRRAVLVAIIGGLMLSVSSETLLRQLYRDDPQLVEAIVNQIHYPHDRVAQQAYRKQMHDYRHRH